MGLPHKEKEPKEGMAKHQKSGSPFTAVAHGPLGWAWRRVTHMTQSGLGLLPTLSQPQGGAHMCKGLPESLD